MKLIITFLVCAVCVGAFGQKHAPITAYPATIDWNTLELMKIDRMPEVCYPLNYFKIRNDSVIRVPYITLNDTLEIKDIAIRYIKIGDKVYEIKRGVDLIPVQPQFYFPNPKGIQFQGFDDDVLRIFPRYLPSIGIVPN